MKKDLLIGAADLYDWSKIKVWAKSIRATGFDGDVALITYRITNMDEVIENCKKLKIIILRADSDSWGNLLVHNQKGRDTICHQMRFFHIWQYLSNTLDYYGNVITTDVRDVVFQSNPSVWLYENMTGRIIAPSEAIKYKDEPWNLDNAVRGYGPYVMDSLKQKLVFNIGTIAGTSEAIKNMSLVLYSMGEGRYIPNDQSSFAILVNGLMAPITQLVYMEEGWACQCAVPFEKPGLKEHMVEASPVLKDGLAYTAQGELFVLIHQWDRIPELKAAVEKRYE